MIYVIHDPDGFYLESTTDIETATAASEYGMTVTES